MNIALILSGGTGTRMGVDVPKQYMEVAGRPIFTYCGRRRSWDGIGGGLLRKQGLMQTGRQAKEERLTISCGRRSSEDFRLRAKPDSYPFIMGWKILWNMRMIRTMYLSMMQQDRCFQRRLSQIAWTVR